jgi:hypothetical protein
MPKYNLPKPKPQKKSKGDECVPCEDTEWKRKIHGIPANKEILESLEAGGDYVVVLHGRVEALSSRERVGDKPHRDFDISISSVEVYPPGDDNEFSKLVEDE